ncbi:hypothetical protein [Catellatospora citrea]|uniref:DUF2567 domain-containing protein n=1 Tax=Catellatospora citrea TaxID=53366 RepID=A0A8J3KG31_9ACTN|nr:hypothetical protein [Catellatospora citrea]RKE07087.1 hypothetical protein C8E86_1912 [Catellatospora citrea]GIF95239.1 hypothetical protein Cci01nite_03330 [Catellatospora citrea]
MLSDDTSQYHGPIEPGRPVSGPGGGRGADVLWALALAVVIAVLGLGLGLLWHAVAPTLPLRIVEEGAVYTSTEPEQLAAAEGWFVLLGLGFGMLCAIAAWALLPARRGPIQLAGLLLGTLIAGWAAWWLGHDIGLAAYQDKLAHAPVDTLVQRPVDLRAVKKLSFFPYAIGGVLLIPALGAVVTYALAAAWSRWPSLRRHEDEQEWAAHDDDQFIAGAGPS